MVEMALDCSSLPHIQLLFDKRLRALWHESERVAAEVGNIRALYSVSVCFKPPSNPTLFLWEMEFLPELAEAIKVIEVCSVSCC